MDKRVQFDFELEFTNGGGLQGQEFRLDIDGENIADQELAKYIVEDMRLLMVGEVRIFNKKIINEKHKRNAFDESSGCGSFNNLIKILPHIKSEEMKCLVIMVH